GSWYLGNGTIANGTVNVNLSTRPPNFYRTGSTLQNITLAGNLTYNALDDVYIAGGGLTLAGGSITINNGSTLNFSRAPEPDNHGAYPQRLDGKGRVTFTNGSLNVLGGGQLTIGAGVTIDGRGGTINSGTSLLGGVGTAFAATSATTYTFTTDTTN